MRELAQSLIKGKIDNIALFLNSVDAARTYLKGAYEKQKGFYDRLERSIEGMVERVLEYIPNKRIDGIMFHAAIQKNGGARPIKKTDELVPAEYREYDYSKLVITLTPENTLYWQTCFFKRRVTLEKPLTAEEQKLWNEAFPWSIPTRKTDDKLRKDLENGVIVEGAMICEQGSHLVIKEGSKAIEKRNPL
jgi:hypothetical protein